MVQFADSINLDENVFDFGRTERSLSEILIVDDQYFNIIAMQAQLHKVRTASDFAITGQTALTMFEERLQAMVTDSSRPGYKLMFIDFCINEISGPELASSAELGTRCLALAAASGRMRSGKFLECCSELYPAAGRKFRQLGC